MCAQLTFGGDWGRLNRRTAVDGFWTGTERGSENGNELGRGGLACVLMAAAAGVAIGRLNLLQRLLDGLENRSHNAFAANTHLRS